MYISSYGKNHAASIHAREILRYIGPGILITVGFIDPGNWASNLAAGAEYGNVLIMDGNTIYDYADFSAA